MMHRTQLLTELQNMFRKLEADLLECSEEKRGASYEYSC